MATIEEVIGKAKADMLLAVKERMFLAAKEIVELTPTRTGRTRNSFVASIGQPAAGTDPKERGAPYDHDGADALAQIAETIDAVQPGQTVYLTSDYANALRCDVGDKHMAPHQMVERAEIDWGL